MKIEELDEEDDSEPPVAKKVKAEIPPVQKKVEEVKAGAQ